MIYADNNATTRIDPVVLKTMVSALDIDYGNPGSPHAIGKQAKNLIENARSFIAEKINCSPEEIIFTSGGTEANNLAVSGVMLENFDNNEPPHMAFSSMEHPSVKGMFFKNLSKMGCAGTFMDVDDQGVVSPETINSSIERNTKLVAVMHANNETGVLEPVGKIGKICKEKGIHFHIDTVQTFGKIPIDVKAMNASSLSGSAHKIYGPKGAGFLYLKKGTPFKPRFFGGHQQSGLRPGTENVAGIAGLHEAFRLCLENMDEENSRIQNMRDYFEKSLTGKVKDIRIQSQKAVRLSNTSNIGFKNIKSGDLMAELDKAGICCSAGSACANSRAAKGTHSPVLDALKVPEEYIEGCIRVSFGRNNNMDEVETIVSAIVKSVEKLRDN